MNFERTARVIDDALTARVCSALTAEVGRADGVVWQAARGRLSFAPDAPAVNSDTIFDLASLTKVLATTSLALTHAAAGRLDLTMLVSRVVPSWSALDRAAVTLRDLFEHCSGLPAHRPYSRTCAGRGAFVDAISAEPLESPPRSRAVYSDLGFILLGVALETLANSPLDEQFRAWRTVAGLRPTIDYFSEPPPDAWRASTAFTEHDAWRDRLLAGEVHDENAAALGGVAGHAGLFGDAAAVGDVARWWLSLLRGADDNATGVAASLATTFVQRSSVPGSSRAIGWDTMLPTSSCGTHWSPHAIGHTGFTGTSLWIDPARDLYAVLLTNRVHPTRANDGIRQVRRDFHDAVSLDVSDG